jgi:hypothetical protein
MGIQLPGSYCFKEVNNHSKIISIVDFLPSDILKEVWAKLRAWLDSALIAKRTSGEEGTLESTLSVYPATTPPACIAKLLRLTRSDMDQACSEARLKKSIANESGSLGPAAHALVECLSKTRIEDLMVQSYSAIVVERLGSISGTFDDDNISDKDNSSDEEEEKDDMIEQEEDYDSNLACPHISRVSPELKFESRRVVL